MTIRNRPKGFASLDALFSLLPIMLMLALLMRVAGGMAERAQEAAARQQAFDKLVSIADYTIESGAAVHEGGCRFPNLLDEGAMSEAYSESLRERAGLSSLYVGTGEPETGYPMCITRLYVESEGREIRMLHVCGG